MRTSFQIASRPKPAAIAMDIEKKIAPFGESPPNGAQTSNGGEEKDRHVDPLVGDASQDEAEQRSGRNTDSPHWNQAVYEEDEGPAPR